jgi:hypothetical protein
LKDQGELSEGSGKFRLAIDDPKPAKPPREARAPDLFLRHDREISRSSNYFADPDEVKQKLNQRFAAAPANQISDAKRKLEVLREGVTVAKAELARLENEQIEAPEGSARVSQRIGQRKTYARSGISRSPSVRLSTPPSGSLSKSEAASFNEAATKIFGPQFKSTCDVGDEVIELLRGKPWREFLRHAEQKKSALRSYAVLRTLARKFLSAPEIESGADVLERAQSLLARVERHGG